MTKPASAASPVKKRKVNRAPFSGHWQIALSCLVGVMSCGRLEAASCSSLVTGAVGWWPGDGTPADLISTNNGILQSGATAAGIGLIGNCFTFDGTNNYVQIPDSSAF